LVEISFTMVVQILNFCLLLWLLNKFLYGPLLDYIDRRSEGVSLDLSEAKRLKKEAAEIIKQQEIELQRVKKESQTIVRDAHKRAEKEHNEIIASAEKESHKIIKTGKETVKIEFINAAASLKNSVADIAVDIAQKVIEKEVKMKDHKKLVEEALEKFETWN